jgi:hypothetical protein
VGYDLTPASPATRRGGRSPRLRVKGPYEDNDADVVTNSLSARSPRADLSIRESLRRIAWHCARGSRRHRHCELHRCRLGRPRPRFENRRRQRDGRRRGCAGHDDWILAKTPAGRSRWRRPPGDRRLLPHAARFRIDVDLSMDRPRTDELRTDCHGWPSAHHALDPRPRRILRRRWRRNPRARRARS